MSSMNEPEHALRAALRHVREGRERIAKQYEVIERLHASGHCTRKAEIVLQWLNEAQRGFEDHYSKLLADGQENREKDPEEGRDEV